MLRPLLLIILAIDNQILATLAVKCPHEFLRIDGFEIEFTKPKKQSKCVIRVTGIKSFSGPDEFCKILIGPEARSADSLDFKHEIFPLEPLMNKTFLFTKENTEKCVATDFTQDNTFGTIQYIKNFYNLNHIMNTECNVDIHTDKYVMCVFDPIQHCQVKEGRCHCSEGRRGPFCNTYDDPCEDYPCYNDGKCKLEKIENEQKPKCTCSNESLYGGDQCENELHCKDFKDCIKGSCVKGSNSKPVCKCDVGFQGPQCDKKIVYCDDNAYCEYGGTCLEQIGHYTCNCKEGYRGQYCQTSVKKEKDNSNKIAIVAGAGGAVVFLFGGISTALFLHRKKKKRRALQASMGASVMSSTMMSSAIASTLAMSTKNAKANASPKSVAAKPVPAKADKAKPKKGKK